MEQKRDWWELAPRDYFTLRASFRAHEHYLVVPAHLRDFFRWQDESWAMQEARWVRMKERIYR